MRRDIRFLPLDSLGVARSRNAVISSAKGNYIAFADDDARPLSRGQSEALAFLDANADVAVLAGRSVDLTGHPRKRYAKGARKLNRWNSAKFGTIEIIARKAPLLSRKLTFDERFGAGATNYLGDEYIFLTDAMKLGLRCLFRPVDLAEHDAESSGTNFGTPADASVRSAIFDRVFGRAAPVARFAFVLRNPRKLGGLGFACRFITGRRADA